jgi:reducing polyketide synthase SwnK
MTRDFDRIGRDFDFLNPHAPSCAEFFDLLGDVSGREPKEMMAFGAWKRQALDYAATHPASPLARIAAVLDGYTDETAAAMFGGLQVGEHVFGGEEYPAPLINRQFVKTYMNRINQSNGSWPSSSERR